MKNIIVYLLFFIISTAGCASTGNVHRSEKEKDFSISSFSKGEVKEFETSPEAENYKIYSSQIREVLIQHLPSEQLFQEVSSYEEEGNSEGVLIIEGKLLRFKSVSRSQRIWLGMMAGRSGIEMEVVLRDKATGKVLAQNVILVQSSLARGALSATNRETINSMARQIIVYLKSLP